MKDLMKKAHELTREIKKEFPEVDYKTQLGICLSYLYSQEEVVTWDTIEKAAYKYCENYTDDLYANWSCNNWTKGNNNRTYITVRVYKKGSLRKEFDCGYWDNNKQEYVAYSRYHKVLNLLTLDMK